jgi:DNA-3-methyladenine glycosylase
LQRLDKEYYTLDAVSLAQRLIGKLLCRKIDDKVIKKRITETEAYLGESDTACHAHKGKTKRTSVMYKQGGVSYIYLCYGMYNMLNVVSGEKDSPQAVLIRGIEGYNGPGKLTKYLNITRELNDVDLTSSNDIWIEDDNVLLKYKKTPRIGISYAEKKDRERLWRFVVEKDDKKTK